MSWQDWVIGIGQFFFLVALIPSIRSDRKPALATSVMTASILTVFVPTQWTLELYLSVVSAASIAAGWWILAYQSWRAESRPRRRKRRYARLDLG